MVPRHCGFVVAGVAILLLVAAETVVLMSRLGFNKTLTNTTMQVLQDQTPLMATLPSLTTALFRKASTQHLIPPFSSTITMPDTVTK